jgi:hypothetical protein
LSYKRSIASPNKKDVFSGRFDSKGNSRHKKLLAESIIWADEKIVQITNCDVPDVSGREHPLHKQSLISGKVSLISDAH